MADMRRTPPDGEQEQPRSDRVRPLEISVFPPELLLDSTTRSPEVKPSAARQGPAGPARRAASDQAGPTLAGVGIAAVVAIVVVGVLALTGGSADDGPAQGRDGGQQAAGDPPPQPSSVTGGIEIPNLVGQSAFQAQERLRRLGLEYGPVVPATGTPGVVVATSPQAGAMARQGTEVTLFIGTRSDRLGGSSTPG